MMEKIYETYSEEDTERLSYRLADKLDAGDVICVRGDLGVGKSVMARGIARRLGIKRAVQSPTFTIIKSYNEGKLALHHIDAYRIEDESEIEDIGIEECIYSDGITIIEWPDNISSIIPDDVIDIEISKDLSQGDDYRKIMIRGIDL